MKKIYLLFLWNFVLGFAKAQENELQFGKNWVFQFTGNIGEFSTKMTLTQEVQSKGNFSKEQNPDGSKKHFAEKLSTSPYVEFYEGFYFYEKYFEPMRFYGYREKTGEIVLEVVSEHELGPVLERFQGHWEGNRFVGEWTLLSSKKTLPFRFEILSTDLSWNYFSASEATTTKLSSSQVLKGRYSEGSLFPQESTESGLKSTLIATCAEILMPDTAASAYRKWDFYSNYRQAKEKWFQWFQKERSYDASYQYRRENISLVWCDNSYLTFCITLAYYTGYAPRTETHYQTFDLKKKKRLRFSEVFKANARENLSALIQKRIRASIGTKLFTETFGSEKDEYADFFWNEDSFALTLKGVLFNPNNKNSPQNNDADVRVFLPYEEIQKYLKVKF